MTTIRDVAKRAGVAPITVSRAINNSGYVSDEKRAKIETAIAELGYVPNTLARSLRSRRTNTLALVLTDITNPFWTTVARGVEDAASDARQNVIFCNTDESVIEQQRYLEVLLQKQVDGILLAPVNSSPDQIEMVMARNVPLVTIDRRITGAGIDAVYCDSLGGARALVEYLISLGHRRIAILNGPQEVATAADRQRGYEQALLASSLHLDDRLVFSGGFDLDSGYRMALEALALDSRPSALFAANNFIAIGAIRALRDEGVSIPEEMAVVGFDDLPDSLVIDPFLTCAAQPAYEMGHKATQLLLARLMDSAPRPAQEILLPTQLIIRRSSGQALAN